MIRYELEIENLNGGGIVLATYEDREAAIEGARSELGYYDPRTERINVNEVEVGDDGNEEYTGEVWTSPVQD